LLESIFIFIPLFFFLLITKKEFSVKFSYRKQIPVHAKCNDDNDDDAAINSKIKHL